MEEITICIPGIEAAAEALAEAFKVGCWSLGALYLVGQFIRSVGGR